jgi:hypothetical protein
MANGRGIDVSTQLINFDRVKQGSNSGSFRTATPGEKKVAGESNS